MGGAGRGIAGKLAALIHHLRPARLQVEALQTTVTHTKFDSKDCARLSREMVEKARSLQPSSTPPPPAAPTCTFQT